MIRKYKPGIRKNINGQRTKSERIAMPVKTHPSVSMFLADIPSPGLPAGCCRVGKDLDCSVSLVNSSPIGEFLEDTGESSGAGGITDITLSELTSDWGLDTSGRGLSVTSEFCSSCPVNGVAFASFCFEAVCVNELPWM